MTSKITDRPSMDEPANAGGDRSAMIRRHPLSGSKVTPGIILDRPGILEGSWERWFLPTEGGDALRLDLDSPIPRGLEKVTAIPSSLLYSWPLWLSSDGVPEDLARLELSGRHFLKRGMENSLIVIPIQESGGRRLVMAVAPEEPFPQRSMLPAWKESSRFQLPCNVLGNVQSHDLVFWQEWGLLRMAFLRDGKTVWFCTLDAEGAGGIVQRSALRLLSEKVIGHLPLSIALCGMTPKVMETCSGELHRVLPKAQIHGIEETDEEGHPSLPKPPPPVLSVDIPPAEAVADRNRRGRLRRLLNFAAAGIILYLLLILWGAGDLLIRKMMLNRLRHEAASLSESALRAKDASDRWNASRRAVDPSTYPLDLLAAAAVPTEGGKVRLTSFSMDQDHVQISGEATDVTQAYAFIEQLKNNPLLQEYEWTSGQPQLAGKNSVRFEMTGERNLSKP